MVSSRIINHLGGFGAFQKQLFILSCITQGISRRCYVPGCDNVSTQYDELFFHFAIPNTTDDFGEVIPDPCNYYEQEGIQDQCEQNAFNKTSVISCTSYVWDTAEFESTTISEVNAGSDRKERKIGLLSLMKNPYLRKWSINLFVNWAGNTMVYYGLALSAGHLYGDIYMNFSILAFVEIPSILLATVALVQFGSWRILCLLMIFSSLSCGATIFTPSDLSWVSVLLTVI